MKQRKMRVLLASESPDTRYALREMIEGGNGAVIVAQAENAIRALALARNLRPDIAIIDSQLPHTIGLDNVVLSRIGGLDTAQSICEEIPDIRVVLVNNLEVLPESTLSSDVTPPFSREILGTTVPFTIQELYREGSKPGTVVFANVQTKPRVAMQRVAHLSDKAILFGGFGLLGGLSLMLTIILAGAGIYLAMAGAAAMLLGLGVKLVASISAGWRKGRAA